MNIDERNMMLKVWLRYLIFALFTFCFWTANDRFKVNGDEPHYLVIADSILKDHSLELTKAYRREFQTRNISEGGLAARDATPSPTTTHGVIGLHGLYSIHNIGLSLLVAIPFKIAGIIGAKLFLILLSSFIVILSWNISSLFTANLRYRVLSTIACTYGLPLIPASNQIFPDMLAGLISLTIITSILKNTIHKTEPLNINLIILQSILIAFLPWLQIKFAATALILAGGMLISAYRDKNFKLKSLLLLLILGASLLLLALYNSFAFGNFAGPYEKNALVIDLHALMVFIGLHLDKHQGIFIQNPIYFLGLLYLIPFLKQYKIQGAIILLVYASLIVPNSLHTIWYGGGSFAGRFAWSASLAAIPFVLYGIVSVLSSNSTKARNLIILFIFIQFVFYIEYTFIKSIDLFNKAPELWPALYPTLLIPITNFLPTFYNIDWAFKSALNILSIIFFIVIVIIGAFQKKHNFKLIVSLYFLIIFLTIIIVSATDCSPNPPLTWQGARLLTDIGIKNGGSLTTPSSIKTNPAMLTSGPYLLLPQGQFKFTLKFEAHNNNAHAAIGEWTIHTPSSHGNLLEGKIFSSREQQVISQELEVPAKMAGKKFEYRIYYFGKGVLTIHSLQVEQKKYPAQAFCKLTPS